ncbi:AbrB/MazE/SpoVT family DNA-binding domain-containing protein [Peribacillus castrilensis]|uniref:AbrB/MazE/SpoVT family DNA-binding domain-containing protein n=1 Tax=Peribacillus castrilensis TaxID=2897690 RepID=UPI003D2721CD
MKSSGVIRKVDSLGRIIVPIEMRKVLGWETGTEIEFWTEGNTVVLKAPKKEQKTNEALDTLEEVEKRTDDPELKAKISEVIRFLVNET